MTSDALNAKLDVVRKDVIKAIIDIEKKYNNRQLNRRKYIDLRTSLQMSAVSLTVFIDDGINTDNPNDIELVNEGILLTQDTLRAAREV